MSTMEEPLIQNNERPYDLQLDHARLEKSYFEVMGLCCSSEVALIEAILKPLNGVKEISVIVPSKTVIVVHDSLIIAPSQIAQALNRARLEASIRPKEERNNAKKWPGKWNMVCGLLLALSFLKYVYPPMQWLAIVAVLLGAPNILWRSIASIRNLTLNVNVIVLIAVCGTIALQDYTDAAIIVFLYNIAQWLETLASHRALSVMSSLTSMTPLKATLAETGEQIDVTSVGLGTIIAVKAGEIVPIDGVVVEGKCEVDEKALNGESFPVTKEIGASVWAGVINLNGYISVKTTALAENCLVARMVSLVEEAQGRKARIQTFIDNCAKWYIPVVVLISGGIAVTPVIFNIGDNMPWFRLALIVLVSACPCALVISTPVTIFCALSKAATLGLLFKGGDYLELLAKVKTVAFDKTGTITRGEFTVTDFQSLDEALSLEKLLFWVSSIESKSSHPMASALVDYAIFHSVEPLPNKVEEFHNYPGEGIYGKVDGEHVYIGNYRISLRAGRGENYDKELSKRGKASGFVYVGATLVGTFSLSDNCRTGVKNAISDLKDLGIRTVMLTGDNNESAQQVQDQLEQGLDAIYAQLLPEDKARIIDDMKSQGVVAMVGDGINDALALASADIGISMGVSGSALAMETGHVILMSNDIRKIPHAIQISKRASRKIVENVIISFTTKGVVLALAIVGYPMLLTAVLTDVLTCLLVIFNSMLLLGGTPNYDAHSIKVERQDMASNKAGFGGIRSVLGQYRSSKKCCDGNNKDIEKAEVCTKKCCDGNNDIEKAEMCKNKCCDGNKKDIEKAEVSTMKCCDDRTKSCKVEGSKNERSSSKAVEINVRSCCSKKTSTCRRERCDSSSMCKQLCGSTSLNTIVS